MAAFGMDMDINVDMDMNMGRVDPQPPAVSLW